MTSPYVTSQKWESLSTWDSLTTRITSVGLDSHFCNLVQYKNLGDKVRIKVGPKLRASIIPIIKLELSKPFPFEASVRLFQFKDQYKQRNR